MGVHACGAAQLFLLWPPMLRLRQVLSPPLRQDPPRDVLSRHRVHQPAPSAPIPRSMPPPPASRFREENTGVKACEDDDCRSGIDAHRPRVGHSRSLCRRLHRPVAAASSAAYGAVQPLPFAHPLPLCLCLPSHLRMVVPSFHSDYSSFLCDALFVLFVQIWCSIAVSCGVFVTFL